MLRIALLTLSSITIANAVIPSRIDWGGAVRMGPSKSTIINVVTTLTPGRPPLDQRGMLVLWPGIYNSSGANLVQTVLQSFPTRDPSDGSPGSYGNGSYWCGANENEWCTCGSLYTGHDQKSGKNSKVKAKDRIRIEYNLKKDNKTWEQIVTNADTNKSLSYYSHESGPYMRLFDTAIECQNGCTPTASLHYYENTKITLKERDDTFLKSVYKTGKAEFKVAKMDSAGRVLTIRNMTMPAGNAM